MRLTSNARLVFTRTAADHVPTVAVDLDGTLAEYDGWKGDDVIGEPRPGAAESMQRLKKMGVRVIIWTTRGNRDQVGSWLKEHDIPFDHINRNPDQPEGASDKVIADVYLDDKAVSALDLRAGVEEVVRILEGLNDESKDS